MDPTEKLKRQKRAARFGNGQASGVGPGRGLESFSWEEENDAVQVSSCCNFEKSIEKDILLFVRFVSGRLW